MHTFRGIVADNDCRVVDAPRRLAVRAWRRDQLELPAVKQKGNVVSLDCVDGVADGLGEIVHRQEFGLQRLGRK